jgi:methyltransferase OMS1, mitochondrial
MATTNLARNGSLLVAVGGIYVAACYIGYSAVQKNKADIEETERALSHDNFSFISNPNRTDQFQNVASKYDNEIGRDESVMGINFLRRSLLYFHAKGTVLEVGAGTGRNVCELCVFGCYCCFWIVVMHLALIILCFLILQPIIPHPR